MNYIKHLGGFFEKVSQDYDLNPTHISLYMAVFQVWNQNRFHNPICISRDELMRISKIASYATYHKCIKDLNDRNYVVYNPSYNPYKGSTLEVINFESYTKPILKKNIKKLKTQLKNSQLAEQVIKQPIEQVAEHVVEQALNKHCTSTEHVPYKHITNNTNIINLGEQAKKNETENQISNEFLDSETQNQKKKLREKNETQTAVMLNDVEGGIPNRGEVQKFFLENNSSSLEAEKFFNYFQSNGWLVGGKTKMKNWNAAARNWMLNSHKFQKSSNAPQPNHLQTPNFKNYGEPL